MRRWERVWFALTFGATAFGVGYLWPFVWVSK